jgi:uncharacterized protein YcfJ
LALVSTATLGQQVIYDYGTVVESVPIVKNFRVATPREECWEEDVVHRESRGGSELSTVVGAVLGGAIGNAVGHSKKNKQVGVIVGAVLGGSIGNAMSANRRTDVYHETEEVCRTYRDYYEEERVVGYRVRYRFRNETYTTRTDVDPGDTIRLRLSISPAQ